jgi:hypothetical protein
MPRPTGAEGGIGRDIYGPDGVSFVFQLDSV